MELLSSLENVVDRLNFKSFTVYDTLNTAIEGVRVALSHSTIETTGTEVEAQNYASARGIGEVPPAYVIVKRRNSSIGKAWVICSLEQWIKEKE